MREEVEVRERPSGLGEQTPSSQKVAVTVL